MTKTCFKCNRTLQIEEFYAHPEMADGRLGKCKECTKKDVRERYNITRDKRSEYEKRRCQTPERKRSILESQKRMMTTHPEKTKARNAVSNAVRDGRLTKPKLCSVCGQDKRLQAHHDDYSKLLEVRWMYFKCHREVGHGQKCSGVPHLQGSNHV